MQRIEIDMQKNDHANVLKQRQDLSIRKTTAT
jgi:hypothetical protein